MSRKHWTDEKLFFRVVNNKSDKTYWHNIRELRSRANENIFHTCVRLIGSPKATERIIGIDVLAQLGLPPRPFFKVSRKLFFDILKTEKNSKALLSVLYAIGHNNEKLKPAEIALLVSFKDDADEGVREGLVYALLSVDNKRAIDTLVHLTTDKVAHIRDWATFGIGTQIERDNTTIREALWQRIDDKDRYTKFEAIVGLAKRKDIRVKEKIIRELLHWEYEPLLFEAIVALNDKAFLPLLKQNLVKAQQDKIDNSDWIRELKNCISTITKFGV